MCKVIHIATADIGLRFLLFNQLQSLQQAGYRVMGACSPGPYNDEIRRAGIPVFDVPMTRRITPVADLRSLWQLYSLFRRLRPAIVHTHNPKPGLLGQLAARMARVPIVVNTLHGFYFHADTPFLRRRFFILMEQIAGRCSDVILSQNREDIETAISKGICPPHKIKLLGNGIDLRCFDPARIDREALRQKRLDLGLAADRPVVGFVGRLVVEKGILELLQAARTIRQEVSGVQFLIIGLIDDDKPDALTPAVAQEYGVADGCIFTGLRRDMPDLYALMDVFALPSHREGFPRSPMEASAMGVPSVVTDIRGCREAVEDGRNGVLVPLGDVSSLAKAILDLLTRRDKAQRMSTAARQMAMERFDEDLVFERVKTEYARLLGESRGNTGQSPCPSQGASRLSPPEGQ
jgi:glycosyltransferase involved in cell wall biosynthesis